MRRRSSGGEGNDNPLQCSCLESPRDWEAWWAAVYGVAQSRTRLERLSRPGWHTVPLLRTPLCPHSSSSPGGRGNCQPPPCTSGPISMESAPWCRRRTRASFCPKGHPFHSAHMTTPVLRPGQKGTPQKCQNLGVEASATRCHPAWGRRPWGGHTYVLPPHTCHPCHLLAHLSASR